MKKVRSLSKEKLDEISALIGADALLAGFVYHKTNCTAGLKKGDVCDIM